MPANDLLMHIMRTKANETTIKAIDSGRISIDDEIVAPFIAANLTSNPQIIDVLKAMNKLIMSDMEKEYVDFFLEKVREIANTEMRL